MNQRFDENFNDAETDDEDRKSSSSQHRRGGPENVRKNVHSEYPKSKILNEKVHHRMSVTKKKQKLKILAENYRLEEKVSFEDVLTEKRHYLQKPPYIKILAKSRGIKIYNYNWSDYLSAVGWHILPTRYVTGEYINLIEDGTKILIATNHLILPPTCPRWFTKQELMRLLHRLNLTRHIGFLALFPTENIENYPKEYILEVKNAHHRIFPFLIL